MGIHSFAQRAMATGESLATEVRNLIASRLGVAAQLRQTGLPTDYANDVVSCTTVTGIELSRVPIPSRAERAGTPRGPDTGWPTPEPPRDFHMSFI